MKRILVAVLAGAALTTVAACNPVTAVGGSPAAVTFDPCQAPQSILSRFPGNVPASNKADVTATFVADAATTAPGFKACFYAPAGADPKSASTTAGFARYPSSMQAGESGRSVYQSVASGAAMKPARAQGTLVTLPRSGMLVESADVNGTYRVQGECKVGDDYWLLSFMGEGSEKAADEAAVDSAAVDMGCQPVSIPS